MKVIGITGEKRHGKGEAAAAIQRLVPGAVETGFADRLKISMMRALGFDREPQELIDLANECKVSWRLNIKAPSPSLIAEDTGWGEVVHSLSGRELLQWFGTEGGRLTFGESFWIDQVLPNPNRAAARAMGDTVTPQEIMATTLEQMYPGAPVVAISDVRFDNEAERVRAVGGINVEIVRPGLVDSSKDSHASEAGVEPRLIDYTIVNDAGLDTLQWRVEQMLELEGVLPCF